MDITPQEFKDFYDRGQFSYGVDIPDVRDSDIEKAITEGKSVYNEGIYNDETTHRLALMYVSAHFLTLDIESSDSGGQPRLLQSSRSANGISESLNIPEWMNDPSFSAFTCTYYGQKFLEISKPYLGGAVYIARGRTTP